MNPSRSILRRRFLTLLLWVGGVGLGRPRGVWAALRGRGVQHPAASRLAEVLVSKDSAAIVGRAYLRRAPGEANVQSLLASICSTWPGGGTELLETDTETLRAVLHRQQREDFEHGRVVDVEGWVLSATEARLCAMTAIMWPGR